MHPTSDFSTAPSVKSNHKFSLLGFRRLMIRLARTLLFQCPDINFDNRIRMVENTFRLLAQHKEVYHATRRQNRTNRNGRHDRTGRRLLQRDQSFRMGQPGCAVWTGNGNWPGSRFPRARRRTRPVQLVLWCGHGAPGTLWRIGPGCRSGHGKRCLEKAGRNVAGPVGRHPEAVGRNRR